MTGWHLARALTTRARVAIAQGDLEQGESDAHEALTMAIDIHVYQVVPDALEILMESVVRQEIFTKARDSAVRQSYPAPARRHGSIPHLRACLRGGGRETSRCAW